MKRTGKIRKYLKNYFKNMDSFRWWICAYIVLFHVQMYWLHQDIRFLSNQLYQTNVNMLDGLEIERKQIKAFDILHNRIKKLENDSIRSIVDRPNS